MPQVVNCMPILFADDTGLVFFAPDLISLTKIMNKELQVNQFGLILTNSWLNSLNPTS